MLPTPLRAWQVDCLRAWREEGCRGTARVATGAGKTLLALAAADALAEEMPAGNLRVRIVVPTLFLATQWRADILRETGAQRRDVGLYHGQIKEDENRPFVIYVVNTARRHIARHILRDAREGRHVLLVCDECHHMISPENARCFDFLPHIDTALYSALGLSATPPDPLPEALGKEIFHYDIHKAVREGVAAKYALFNIALRLDPDEAARYDSLSEKIVRLRSRLFLTYPKIRSQGGDFMHILQAIGKRDDQAGALARSLLLLYLRRREISHLAESRIDCAEALIRSLQPEKRIILFAERIETVNALYRRLEGCRVGRYHSKMDARAKAAALENFRAGETSILLCCRALDEGLNVPDADAGIMLSSTGSPRQRIQRLGRILRQGKGIRCAYYLHIPEGGDASALLPGGAHSFALHYDEAFVHPLYDAAAERVLASMPGASEAQLSAARAALHRGRLRADFLLSSDAIRAYIKSAPASQKDYWITMLMMAKARAFQ